MNQIRTQLMLCGGTGCHANKSAMVREALENELKSQNLHNEVKVIETGCNGFCAVGPVMLVQPEGIFYQKLTSGDMAELVEEHFLKGRPVKRLFYVEPASDETIPSMEEIPFFAKQQLIVMRNKGMIDPEKIDEYIARDGYFATAKALQEMTPEQIIEEMKLSGLRGRGGAGQFAGLKWGWARESQSDIKYAICNADEGDPGAFMDRSVLEADPHAVLEGMIIMGRAIGAGKGYIYARTEYPLAIKRLEIAIQQAREYGLLGKDILGTGFDFDIEIYQGAGAFVCGEETALMKSIEGKRGMPRQRPPFPAQRGLWDKPSNINNVETLANVPQIILKGGAWYSGIGTERSKGTKVFALSGTVNNIGLVEVPMGTPLRTIIYDIGGGIKNNKAFKAVQLGGPSGGCVPADHLDIVTDYEEIAKVGAIMGSGGMIVMDETSCMVDMARYFIDFCLEESCGKCTPCREGNKRMLKILEGITEGRGKISDLDTLEKLCHFMKQTTLCQLGGTAPNPVLSMLKYFRHEYEDHILGKYCEASVCGHLYKAKCINTCPLHQDVPGYLSLVGEGRYEDAISLIYQTNPMPAVCGRVCPHPCMEACLRGQRDEALAISKIKRFAADMARRNHIDIAKIVRENIVEPKHQKVAIIGGGPGGLAVGYFLAQMGYQPTIFEELPELGGMLRYGIPSYRLPRDILDGEIQVIMDVGVEAKTNVRVGRDISMFDLQNEYDAIFVGVGAHNSLSLRIAGEDLPGVINGAKFLRDAELGQAEEVGQKVAVVGGGNVAIDVARTCLRMGSKDITIVYRREEKDMPADDEEIEDALEEGIQLKTLLAPKSIMQNNGKLVFELDECELGDYDRSGRRRPVPTGNITREEFDTIVSAIGQSPDLTLSSSINSNRGTIIAERRSLSTNIPGVFAGGDAVTGPARVVDALAAGKRAAFGIDRYLSKKRKDRPFEEHLKDMGVIMVVPTDTTVKNRIKMLRVEVKDRIDSFIEVELGFTEEHAKEECARCLRCDVKL